MQEKQPYTVREVAELTGLSVETIMRMFENEPGVNHPGAAQFAFPALSMNA
jgi:predicted DNA-binding transcriptional regulator AlpA